MNYAYDRYVRPSNTDLSSDPTQTNEILDLMLDYRSEDSFEPLLATQENQKTITPILPGFPATQDPAPEYEIEKILKGRYRNRRLEHLVKWTNIPSL